MARRRILVLRATVVENSKAVSTTPAVRRFRILRRTRPIERRLVGWDKVERIESLGRRCLATVIFCQVLVLTSTSVLLVEVTAMLRSLRQT